VRQCGDQIHQYSVSLRMRSRRAASCGLIRRSRKGRCRLCRAVDSRCHPAIRSVRRFHITQSRRCPVWPEEDRHRHDPRHVSKPPRMGAARIVAPYFAANQLRRRCRSRRGELRAQLDDHPRRSGQPTWLHSSSTCPHPQLHISSCPAVEARLARAQHTTVTSTAERAGGPSPED